MKKQKGNNKRTICKSNKVILLVLIILLIVICFVLSKNITTKEISTKVNILREEIFNQVEEEIEVNKFTVYGTHFNIEANLNIDSSINYENIKDIKLVICDINKEETIYNTEYEIEDNQINIYTSSNINEGIYLENIDIGEYYIFFKIIDETENEKYYSLINKTEYENIEYYTITKNNSNQKIDIAFNEYTLNEKTISYMYMNVAQTKLPSDVYDIVIDPGHGGTDVGAIGGGYYEADLALSVAEKLKEELEDLGLKVMLTRDENSDPDEATAYTMYDEDGRINITNASKAKLVLSIHLNSSELETLKGVEIYASSRANLTFAKSIADNIVNIAKTTYSTGIYYKELDGVYVRTFDADGIKEFAKKAIKSGYEPYDITEDTPYLYMIRETGGICTNAIIDGRNKIYGTNLYYNSNIGLETYLIELGYISNSVDRNNIINNEDLYVQAITDSVKEYFEL